MEWSAPTTRRVDSFDGCCSSYTLYLTAVQVYKGNDNRTASRSHFHRILAPDGDSTVRLSAVAKAELNVLLLVYCGKIPSATGRPAITLRHHHYDHDPGPALPPSLP